MAKIVQPISLYVDGKKFAEVTSGDYNVSKGNESLIIDGGWAGESDGATTSEITPKIIMPKTGTTVNIFSLLLSNRYIRAALPIGGQIHEVDVKPYGASISWDHKSGMASGDWKLRGGKPELVG